MLSDCWQCKLQQHIEQFLSAFRIRKQTTQLRIYYIKMPQMDNNVTVIVCFQPLSTPAMTPLSPANPFMSSTNPFEADMETEVSSAQGMASEVQIDTVMFCINTFLHCLYDFMHVFCLWKLLNRSVYIAVLSRLTIFDYVLFKLCCIICGLLHNCY